MNSASDLFQAGAPGDLEDFADEIRGQAASAKFGMHQHADTADMPFPAAELLVQRRDAHDFSGDQPEQRQIVAVINVLAPVMDNLQVHHAVLDEHPFRFRDAEKKLVEIFFIPFLQRAQRGVLAVLERDGLGKLLEFEFNAV